MISYTHATNGKTCTSTITVELDEDNNIRDLVFTGGGCQGNLKALKQVLIGKSAEFVIENFKGIQCGNRGTSCADQLAQAVQKALEHQTKANPKDCFFYTQEDNSWRHECKLLNDSCESCCDSCVYTTNTERYHSLVNRVKNASSSVIL